MSHSFAPLFAYIAATHQFVVVRAYIDGQLECFTEEGRCLLAPNELIFA